MGINERKKILAISSHADDLEASLGGTLAMQAQQGATVHQIILTDSNGQGWAEKRKEEARAGMAALGLGTMIFFVGNKNNFKDGTLRYYRTSHLAAAVAPIFYAADDRSDPYTELYVMGEKGYTGHPDHRKANRVAWWIFRYISSIASIHQVDMSPEEKLHWDADYAPYGGYFVPIPYVDVSSHTAVDISGTYELKIDLLKAHTSQLNNGIGMHIERLAKLPKKEYLKIENRTVYKFK